MSKKKKRKEPFITINGEEYSKIETMSVRFNLEDPEHLEAFIYVKQKKINFSGGTVEHWINEAKQKQQAPLKAIRVEYIEKKEVKEEESKVHPATPSPPPQPPQLPKETTPTPAITQPKEPEPPTGLEEMVLPHDKPRKKKTKFRI